MSKVPNENILKLRELTDKMCQTTKTDGEYKIVVKKLKKVIDDGKKLLDASKTNISKITCYEAMCIEIMSLLNEIEF